MENINKICRKENIVDCFENYIFDDELGVVQVVVKDITLKSNNKLYNIYTMRDMYNADPIFKKISESSFQYFHLNAKEYVNFLKNSDWDSFELYTWADEKQQRFSNRLHLQKGFEKKINISSIIINVIYKCTDDKCQVILRNNAIEKIFEFNTYNEFANTKFYKFNISKSTDIANYFDKIRPSIDDIKINKGFFVHSYGKVIINEVFDYPNKFHVLFKAIDSKNNVITINDNFDNVYFLPYEQHIDQFSIFDKNINEIALQPYVCHDGQTYNVYWKNISEAAEYVVSLYKVIEINKNKQVYYLKDFIVERNERYLVIDGLIGNTFIFKVKAENRSGEIIAESRGIINGVPSFFGSEE